MTASSATASSKLVETLAAKSGEVSTTSDGHAEILVAREELHGLLSELKNDPELSCDLLLDVCGVDYPDRDERFEVVYHAKSLKHGHRIRVKVAVGEDDCSLPTVTDVWKGADWFEREVWDLFGVRFEGHPNLKRILTHEAFHGHPLRKDYDPGQRWLLREGEVMMPDWAKEPQEDDDHFETQIMNVGPTHPATHGTLRTIVRLDGETITQAECEIGYLHRCFEKMSETHGWQQVIPYTDRLNYCSPMNNGVGYALGVERMLGIEVPERATMVRLILCEFSRIMDHLVCVGTNLVDLGALTNFWYAFQPREKIYELLEACCGGRLTVSYCRIGGLAHDTPHDFVDHCRAVLKEIPKAVNDIDGLITTNQIFRDRVEGIGALTAKEAIDWGWTGPCLRATGVPYDIRRVEPYMGYETFDFDVAVGTSGDTLARYLVRLEEIRQSIRIIEQALDRLQPGPVITDDHRVALPPKNRVYNEMESLIWHFKVVFEGIKVPEGEHYVRTEGGNGELGYYLIADGSGKPYRIKVRPPCFAIFQAYQHMLIGHQLPDAIAILGSLNIIAGELDR